MKKLSNEHLSTIPANGSRRPAVRLWNWMGGIRLLAFAGCLLLGLQQHVRAQEIDLSNYKLTFAEDFDTLSVSAWGKTPSRWIAHTPWAGDFGAARFSDPRHGFPFTLHDGVLRIEAHKDKDGKWSSGLLAGNNPKGQGFSQKYGYFEARMKLPPGPGVWPAFWLVGTDKSKASSEIDVMEYYGRDNTRFASTWHIWRSKSHQPNEGKEHWTKVPPGSLSDAFHTYGVEIAPDKVTFYFDRQETWQIDTPEEYKMPFYPLVNLALGAGWPIDKTPDPSYLWVDYIHIYQKKDPQ